MPLQLLSIMFWNQTKHKFPKVVHVKTVLQSQKPDKSRVGSLQFAARLLQPASPAVKSALIFNTGQSDSYTSMVYSHVYKSLNIVQGSQHHEKQLLVCLHGGPPDSPLRSARRNAACADLAGSHM